MKSMKTYSKEVFLSLIKKMRQERQWSQEQLAEMTGLSVRTIQRIEHDHKAGLESIKALSAVFEIEIVEQDTDGTAQKEKEEKYIQSIKGLYQWVMWAVLSLIYPVISVIRGDMSWTVIGWMLFSWSVFFVIYGISNFDFFGDKWKEKLLKKKFPDRNS